MADAMELTVGVAMHNVEVALQLFLGINIF